MWFVDSDVEVTPGSTTVLQLIVVNVGEETETFRLSVAGLPAPWTTIQPATITVLAGSQDQVDVEVRPPRLPSTAAGSTVMTVRAIAEDRADLGGEVTVALTVAPVQDRRLTLLQPAQRTRRRATFEMTLENRGNIHASCRMRLVDPSGRLEADFHPPAVGVDPGQTSLVRARVRANAHWWERRSRTLPFRVEAEQQGMTPATDAGSLVQLPAFPEHLLGGLLAVLVIAALVLASWFGIIRPAIRDAADDAVRDRVPTTPSTATTVAPLVTSAGGPSGSTPTTSTAPTVTDATPAPTATTVPAAAEQGAALAQRLNVDVAPGQTQTANYVVPAGTLLRVTDVVLQNPDFDKGSASLARNDQVLLTWGIDNMLLVPTAFVTPLEIQGGEQLVFSLTCGAVGGSASQTGTCSASVLLSGRIFPAPAA
ncbi:MAG: hypothetical protein JWM12_1398 [Ilumatobacteraceae bacterium]|nr:hypothetical protein [Ilumatobacteraceae bacterium]